MAIGDYLPNVLQYARYYGSAGLAALMDGLGATKAGDFFRERQKGAAKDIEYTNTRNRDMHTDISLAETEGRLERSRSDSRKTREEGYEVRASQDKEHRNRLQSEERHAKRTAKTLGESKDILHRTIDTQNTVKSTQSEVRVLQRESNKLRTEIATEALAAAKEYRQAVSAAQLLERQTAGVQGATQVEEAQHSLALKIIDKQVALAIQMAQYKSKLEGASLEGQQVLKHKIADCQAAQKLYLAEVTTGLKTDEITKLSGLIRDKLHAKHFQTVQEHRAEARTAMSGAIDRGAEHAEVARTAETNIAATVANYSAKELLAADRIAQALSVADGAKDPSIRQLFTDLPGQLTAAAAAKQNAAPLAAEANEARGPTPLRTSLRRGGEAG